LQVILFQEQIFERLRLGAKERWFGADLGQKYENSMQKYRHSPYLEDTACASNKSKPNKQPERMARPCATSRQPFATFLACTSCLFSFLL